MKLKISLFLPLVFITSVPLVSFLTSCGCSNKNRPSYDNQKYGQDINFDDKSSSNVVNVAKSRLIQYSKLTYVTNISEVDALVEFTNSNFYWELILNLANSKANVSISNWTSDTAAKGIINSANITINGIKISLSNFTPAYAELNKTISFDNSSCQQLNQFTLFSTLNIKIK